MGKIRDGALSVQRTIRNNFMDSGKQEAMDILLCSAFFGELGQMTKALLASEARCEPDCWWNNWPVQISLCLSLSLSLSLSPSPLFSSSLPLLFSAFSVLSHETVIVQSLARFHGPWEVAGVCWHLECQWGSAHAQCCPQEPINAWVATWCSCHFGKNHPSCKHLGSWTNCCANALKLFFPSCSPRCFNHLLIYMLLDFRSLLD